MKTQSCNIIVGAVYDRTFFVDSRHARGHRPRLQWRFTLILVIACLLLPHLLAAQGLTGNLIGTVRDEQEAAVPGGQVRLTSQALIGGPRNVLTDESGRFRFPNLTATLI